MDRLEEEIKRRLANATSTDGVDSQALWDAISKGSYAASPSRKKKHFLFVWLMLVAGIVSPIWLVIDSTEHFTSAYSPRSEHNTEFCLEPYEIDVQQEKAEVLSAENNSGIDENKREGKEGGTNNVIAQSSAIHATVDLTAQESELRNDSKYVEQSNASGYSPSTAILSGHEDSDVWPIDQIHRDVSMRTLSHSEFDQAQSQRVEVFSDTKGTMQRVNPIYIKPTNITLNQPKIRRPNGVNPPEQRTRMPWEFYGGALWFFDDFENGATNFGESLNSSLSTETGYLIGGLFTVKKGKHWNVKFGVEFMSWRDRFDTVILSDTLIQMDEESITGLNIRTVRHFNEASIITLPGQFEIHKDLRVIRLAMNVGASYSFVVNQNGRLLEDEFAVVNYSSEKKRFDNFISLRFAPSIGFKLSEKVLLNTGCGFAFQRHGMSPLNQLKNNSLTVTSLVGITFNY